MKYFILGVVLFLAVFSCKKPNERICLKSSGKSITEEISLEQFSFKGISIYDDININLISDTVDYAIVSSFENRVDFISFEIVDSLLEIKDNNKCNFLRKFEKQTTIDIHHKNISVLSLNGNGKISSTSPIQNEIVHVYSLSSNSDIDLNIKAASLVFKLVNGTLSGKIRGEANSVNIFHAGHSKINFEELKAENLRLTNKSDSDVYLNCTNSLFVELFSIGNVYYKGNPILELGENRFDSEIINNN